MVLRQVYARRNSWRTHAAGRALVLGMCDLPSFECGKFGGGRACGEADNSLDRSHER
jgi:hypothetical protein